MFSKKVRIYKRIPKAKTLSTKAIIAFLIVLALSYSLIGIIITNKSNIEKMTMEQLIMEKSIKITEVISKLLYKTQALAALVIQNNGEVDEFERVSSTIIDDPAILNVILAPSGVVSHVYPLQGNEPLLGYNLLGEGDGNKEAMMAKESGQLVFGGPFNLMQGGEALVGRLPVYLNKADGAADFWGLVSVTLKYPDALDGAGLGILEKQGFTYEIWRINPDDGQRQIIAQSDLHSDTPLRFIEKKIPILNAEWYFRIAPVKEWYQNPENWVLIAGGLFISILIAFIVQNNSELKSVKSRLEVMVYEDALTGTLNRKGLFCELEHMIDNQEAFLLYYLDLNSFKQINDTYGHSFGDVVLIEFCRRVQLHLDDNKLLARIGGDEFVLIIMSDRKCSSAAMDKFWKNVDKEFEHKIHYNKEEGILLTFSKGEAAYPKDGTNIDDLIAYADKKMYECKQCR